MNGAKHLSTFELDVFHAATPAERSLDEGREIAAHVAACAECRAYLDGLDGLGAPPAFAAPEPPRRAAGLVRGGGMRALAPAAAVLALAACVMLFVRAKRIDESTYVGEKGAPALQALIRRDGSVRVWDGASAIRAGDAIALTVACERFGWVTVASGNEPTVRAWDGECPKGPPVTLPFTLVVDAQPGREHFTVVLSHHRLDDARLGAALRKMTHDDDAWTVDFDFAKEER